MGCCRSKNNATEKTALLSEDRKVSIDNTSRSKSIVIDKPKCKCGDDMNLYELQCCYLTNIIHNNNQTIDCQECMLGMTDSTTLLWHCMGKHKYKYDLCIDCAEKVYMKQQENYIIKEEEEKDKYDIFDKKYNNNDINWNELYKLLNDDGRALTVMEIINKYILKNQNYKQILPNNILKFIQKVFKKAQLAQECHDRLCTHDDWTVVVNDVDNISIWYKQEEGTDVHSLKIKSKMKCTPLDIICVLNEFDLLPELISLIPIDTVLIKEYSNIDKIIYTKGHLWFPLKNRDCVARVEALESLDQFGEIIICGKSINPLTDIDDIASLNLSNEILRPDSKSVRMEVKHSEGMMKPIRFGGNDNLTECISILNVDPKSYIPKWLLNWANRTFAFYAAKMIRHRCENLKGTKHAKRIATKPIYRKWKRDMMEYINRVQSNSDHILNKQIQITSQQIPDQLNNDNDMDDQKDQTPPPPKPKLPNIPWNAKLDT